MTRRGFVLEHDLQFMRRCRTAGELCLWRARAATGERRAALLEGARASYVLVALVMRVARYRALGLPEEERRTIRRMVALDAAFSARAGGPDA